MQADIPEREQSGPWEDPEGVKGLQEKKSHSRFCRGEKSSLLEGQAKGHWNPGLAAFQTAKVIHKQAHPREMSPSSSFFVEREGPRNCPKALKKRIHLFTLILNLKLHLPE